MASGPSHVKPCESSTFAEDREVPRPKPGKAAKWLVVLGLLCGLLCLSLASLLAVTWPCLIGTFRPCNCHSGRAREDRLASAPSADGAADLRATVPLLLPELREAKLEAGPSGRAEARALSGAAAGGGEDHAGAHHQGHPHDALLYLFHAFIIGTVLLHVTTFPGLHNLQTTVVLFLTGIVYSLVHEWLHLDEKLGVLGRSHAMWMGVDPHLILFTMLPALLAGDALSIDTSVVKRVASQCMYLAGPGVLLSAFLTALFLTAYLGWSWHLSLTMGAILAATDPVAVVGLLKQLGAPPTLTIQIAGESLLNDGTAIVLFTLAYELLQGNNFTVSQVVIFVVRKALCACALGWCIGWIFVLWINAASNRFEHHSSTIQIALTFCCAYWSFIMAEGVLNMSGVLCTVVACLVLADKMWMSILEKESMHTVWHVFEFLGNTIIFFLAGALTGNCMAHMVWQDYLHLLVLYLVTTVIRGVIIGCSLPILKFLSPDKKPVSAAEAIIMTWGGLRGAVGLALAIQVSAERAGGVLPETDARRVLFYTGGIATLTLVVNATTCPMLVKALGIVHQDDTARSILLCLHKQMEEMVKSQTEKHKAVSKVMKDLLKEVEFEVGGPPHWPPVSPDAAGADSTNSEAFMGVTPSQMSSINSGRRNSASTTSSVMLQGAEHAKELAKRFLVQKLCTVKPVDCILRDFKESEQWMKSVPRIKLELLDLPEALELPEDGSASRGCLVRDAMSKRHVDPRMAQVVHLTFLALVRAEYWRQIEAGKFIEGSNHPEVLLSSVASAVQRAERGLGDLETLCHELGLALSEPPAAEWFEEAAEPAEDPVVSRLSTGRRRASLASLEQVMEVSNVLAASKLRTSEKRSSRLAILVRSSTFTTAVLLLIVANTAVMFAEESQRTAGQDAPWQIVEALFMLAFFVECACKVGVYGKEYFYSLWNVYDFLLVIFALVSFILEQAWRHDDGSYRDNLSAEARVPRLHRVFRAMFFMRVFRLVKLCQVVKQAFKGHEASPELAKNLRSIIILTAFVRAHRRSQEQILHYFGGFQTCEQARCILESQTMVNKALVLAAREVQKVPRPTLERLIVLRESSSTTQGLTKYVLEAAELGVVSAREAEALLKPLRERSRAWLAQLRESEMGITKSHSVMKRIHTSLHLNGDGDCQASHAGDASLEVDSSVHGDGPSDAAPEGPSCRSCEVMPMKVVGAGSCEVTAMEVPASIFSASTSTEKGASAPGRSLEGRPLAAPEEHAEGQDTDFRMPFCPGGLDEDADARHSSR